MELNTQPVIAGLVEKRDGFAARAMCTVDGFAAEINLDVDSEHQRYSNFAIRVWDHPNLTWSHVYGMAPEEVGHVPLPILGHQETLVKLNEIAIQLWEMANLILVTSRLRQEELNAATFLTEQLTLDESRAARQRGKLVIPTEIAEDPADSSWETLKALYPNGIGGTLTPPESEG